MKKAIKDKNKDLLEQAKKGDTNSKRLLIKEMEGLIINTINGYLNVYNHLEYEDLYQKACEIILECIISYDDSKGGYFSGYVKRMLNYYFYDFNKFLKKDKNMRVRNKVISQNNEEIDILEMVEDKKSNTEKMYLEDELYRRIREEIIKLPKRQKKVIILYYYKQMTIDQISKKLFISESTVKREKKRALSKLRKKL